jgi:predicted GIY-YIG superfamily endonuclease
MFTVYAISSIRDNYIYVWLTDNLERRFTEHNNWYNRTTKPHSPFTLIYQEPHTTREGARLREKYLKSWQWKDFLKTLKQ